MDLGGNFNAHPVFSRFHIIFPWFLLNFSKFHDISRFSRCSLIFPGFPGRVGTLLCIYPYKFYMRMINTVIILLKWELLESRMTSYLQFEWTDTVGTLEYIEYLTFLSSSSRLFSRYLYRRINLKNTWKNNKVHTLLYLNVTKGCSSNPDCLSIRLIKSVFNLHILMSRIKCIIIWTCGNTQTLKVFVLISPGSLYFTLSVSHHILE